MSDPRVTSVDTEVEDHQILATVEAPGLSVAIAVEPWIDHQVVEDVVDDLRRELHHVLDVGPERDTQSDFIAVGGAKTLGYGLTGTRRPTAYRSIGEI